MKSLISLWLLLLVSCTTYKPIFAPQTATFSKEKGLSEAEILKSGDLKLTYFGNATILIEDGTNSILFDGFVSRPSITSALFCPLTPNKRRVEDFLKRAKIKSLDVVAVNHSHYDHVLDAPLVAKLTNSSVLGSKLTQEVCKTLESSVKAVWANPDRVFSYGNLTLKPIASQHASYGCCVLDRIGLSEHGHTEEVDTVSLPIRLFSLKDGGAYTFHVSHPKVNILVQASAGFKRGQTTPSHKANIIFFSVALMDKMSEKEKEEYWDELVTKTGTTGKRLIIPIHWDNLFKPIGKGLKPTPDMIQNVSSSAKFIDQKVSGLANTEVVWMDAYSSIIVN